jgi:hypothetical protein
LDVPLRLGLQIVNEHSAAYFNSHLRLWFDDRGQ